MWHTITNLRRLGVAEEFIALRAWRRRYRVSLREAGQWIGIDGQTLQRIETGFERPRRETLARIRALVDKPAPARSVDPAELDAWRKAHGLTCREFAKLIGVSRRTLQAHRTHGQKPHSRTRARIEAFWRLRGLADGDGDHTTEAA